MLQYVIIAFSIISFCHSALRPGSYAELVLVQRFPISSIFYDPDVDTESDEFAKYSREHQAIFEENRWVIGGFLSYDSNDRPLKRCVDTRNQELTLDQNLLSPNFRQELREKWPVLWPLLTPEEDESSKWARDYREDGSCMTGRANFYFEEGVRLLGAYNASQILLDAGIVPGSEYDVFQLIGTLSSATRKLILVKCLTPKDSDKQYLHEVHVCFDRNNVIHGCRHLAEENRCNFNEQVQYPLAPRN